MAGGYTLSLPESDSNYTTKTKMEEEIVTLLGGRCAEKLILEDISTGASNDLERVTSVAKAMVTRYGFSDRLGNVVYGQDPGQTFLGRDYTQGKGYSEAVASEIDVEVRRIVDEGYRKCMDILSTHIDKLHIVAKELMEYEKISGERFRELMSDDYVEEKTEPEEKEPAVRAAEVIPAETLTVSKEAEETVPENTEEASQATAEETADKTE